MPNRGRSRPLFLILLLSSLLVALIAAACAGPAGPAGPPGAAAGVGGLKIKITGVTIPADRKPVITFKISDTKDNPLKSDDLDTTGTPPVRRPTFTIAKLVEEGGFTRYENYLTGEVTGTQYTYKGQAQKPVLGKITRAVADSGGTLAARGLGEYTYTFGQAIPAEALVTSATHLVAAYASRDTQAYVANDVYSFVPAGGEPKVTRLISSTKTCNQCHDPLQAHGVLRREFGLCITCHTPQTVDPETGNTVDMKVMVHKIHDGRNLPNVVAGKPYLIVGYQQNVFDFGEIGWPQDARNCTTCHQDAPQADNWKTKPSAVACGSCHDEVDFKTGAKHVGGAQPTDAACATCHLAEGPEFGASVAGAHTIPAASSQLPGLKAEIVKVTDTSPGQKPVVTFNLKDGKGNPVAPATLAFLEVTLAHPTTDYAHRVTEMIRRAGTPATATAPEQPDIPSMAVDAGGGNFSYTLSTTVDVSWTGSLAIGLAGYRNVTIKGPKGADTAVREAFNNPVVYAAVTDAKPVVRRTVIKRDNCNQCHKDLGNPAAFSIHGGIRRSTEYCLLCHTANLTDEAYRPPEKMPPESVQYKYMIHSLHKGEERAVATEFYGRGVAATEEIFFPGDLRNCNKCHEGQSYTIPLPANVLPTTITQKGQIVKTVSAIRATCSSCHADAATAGHEDIMTTPAGVETCTVCHGRGKDFAVEKAHARP